MARARRATRRGRSRWADLGTTDADAAKAFYGGLFGWESVDTPVGEGATYSMAKLRRPRRGRAVRPARRGRRSGRPAALERLRHGRRTSTPPRAPCRAPAAQVLRRAVRRHARPGRMAVARAIRTAPRSAPLAAAATSIGGGASSTSRAADLGGTSSPRPTRRAPRRRSIGELLGWTRRADERRASGYGVIRRNGDRINGGITAAPQDGRAAGLARRTSRVGGRRRVDARGRRGGRLRRSSGPIDVRRRPRRRGRRTRRAPPFALLRGRHVDACRPSRSSTAQLPWATKLCWRERRRANRSGRAQRRGARRVARLLRVHARSRSELDAELDARHGLPLTSYEVLINLQAAPAERLRMADLADARAALPLGHDAAGRPPRARGPAGARRLRRRTPAAPSRC